MSAKHILGKAVLVVGLLAMTGCADMTHQEQSMLSGGAAGAAIGAVGTVMTGGCVACGAAIGGAVGTGAGYVVDQINHNSSSSR
ncbi:MAG: hypothetical protein P4M13_03655 [Alphaproteobacteria bacterium]|nr:hypothetical protein [Alphaproteobacteria bacterium]